MDQGTDLETQDHKNTWTFVSLSKLIVTLKEQAAYSPDLYHRMPFLSLHPFSIQRTRYCTFIHCWCFEGRRTILERKSVSRSTVSYLEIAFLELVLKHEFWVLITINNFCLYNTAKLGTWLKLHFCLETKHTHTPQFIITSHIKQLCYWWIEHKSNLIRVPLKFSFTDVGPKTRNVMIKDFI